MFLQFILHILIWQDMPPNDIWVIQKSWGTRVQYKLTMPNKYSVGSDLQ